MKKILVGGLVVILVLGTAFHFSVMYLRYVRKLQMSFAPGISLFNHGEYNLADKDIFRIEP